MKKMYNEPQTEVVNILPNTYLLQATSNPSAFDEPDDSNVGSFGAPKRKPF